MDLVYIPEILTFGSFRNPQYRDYEQPWNSNYFTDGKTTSTYRHHRQQQQRNAAESKGSCHLCRENKRRSLAAYIRGKSRNKSCSEICEEEEEEEEEGEEGEEEIATPASRDVQPDSKSDSKCKKSSAKA